MFNCWLLAPSTIAGCKVSFSSHSSSIPFCSSGSFSHSSSVNRSLPVAGSMSNVPSPVGKLSSSSSGSGWKCGSSSKSSSDHVGLGSSSLNSMHLGHCSWLPLKSCPHDQHGVVFGDWAIRPQSVGLFIVCEFSGESRIGIARTAMCC